MARLSVGTIIAMPSPKQILKHTMPFEEPILCGILFHWFKNVDAGIAVLGSRRRISVLNDGSSQFLSPLDDLRLGIVESRDEAGTQLSIRQIRLMHWRSQPSRDQPYRTYPDVQLHWPVLKRNRKGATQP